MVERAINGVLSCFKYIQAGAVGLVAIAYSVTNPRHPRRPSQFGEKFKNKQRSSVCPLCTLFVKEPTSHELKCADVEKLQDGGEGSYVVGL